MSNSGVYVWNWWVMTDLCSMKWFLCVHICVYIGHRYTHRYAHMLCILMYAYTNGLYTFSSLCTKHLNCKFINFHLRLPFYPSFFKIFLRINSCAWQSFQINNVILLICLGMHYTLISLQLFCYDTPYHIFYLLFTIKWRSCLRWKIDCKF